jgi:transposase
MTTPLQFAAWIGMDWADQEHAVCLCDAQGARPESSTVAQDAEALDTWVAQLRTRFGGRPIAICLEQSRGALIYALMKYDFLILFPINPKQLARYREAFTPSRAKGDPTDAEFLCRLVREHQDRLRAWRPDDELTRSLRLLTEARRKWVNQRTALGNQLLQHLKETYPLAEQFRGQHVHAVSLLALLERFPTQAELQRASPKQLLKWLPKLRRVVDDQPDEDSRIRRIRQARQPVTDAAVLKNARLAIRHLVKTLLSLNQTIAEYDQQIAKLLAEHPDAELFGTFDGAGSSLTPRLIAAFGTDRQRYDSAQDLQQLSGIAPVAIQSGRTRIIRRRRCCPKFLRQTFHEFARCSLQSSTWASAYHRMLRARGHGFHAAVRALAFK